MHGALPCRNSCRRRGRLILSLVSVMLLAVGPKGWLAGLLAVIAAILTRNLPLAMAVGILAIGLIRQAT